MYRLLISASLVFFLIAVPVSADTGVASASAQEALDAMVVLQEATGGWGMKYPLAGSFMWGEYRPIPKDWITVQPASTPTMGDLLIHAAKVLREPKYFDAATRAKRTLQKIQTAEGGFPHEAAPEGKRPKRGTYDDDTTTSALRFFLNYWKHTGKAEDLADVHGVGDFLISSQHACGGWTQYYPTPDSGYSRCITFNDNVFRNVIASLLLLHKETGETRYLDAAKRGGEAILKLQGGAGEAIWAQQYDPDTLEPAWARKFEPPGYAAGESLGVCDTLVVLYLEFEDARYLDSLRRAIEWYDTHKLPNGKWARLYEPDTQTPVYGRRDMAVKVYDFNKATEGYSWQGNWYPQDAKAALELIATESVEALRKQRSKVSSPNLDTLRDKSMEIIQQQDDGGLWLRKANAKELEEYETQGTDPSVPLFEVRQVVSNVSVLLDYIQSETKE